MIGSIAEERISEAVRLIRAPALTYGIRFEVVEGHGSASWCKPLGSRRSTIQVDSKLAESLSTDCLSALILHELMHECGVNHRLLDSRGKNPFLVNLALDIILERTLSEQLHLRQSLGRLNDCLLKDHASQKKLTLAESIIYLVHRYPPMELMPRGFKTRWEQLWKGRIRFVPEDVYALLASVRNLELSKLPDRFQIRYGPGQRNHPCSDTSSVHGSDDQSQASDSITFDPSRHIETGLLSSRAWEMGRLVDFVKYELCSQSVVTRASKRQFGHESRWLQSKIRFDPRAAIRQLIGALHQPKIIARPFLSSPTSDAIAKYLGPIPQLYYENLETSTPTLSTVYVDVSRSVSAFFPHIVAFAKTLKSFHPANVFTFSDNVEPISLVQLSSGKFSTTGGTNINAVLADVVRRKPRQFFIVTDNDLGFIDQSLVQQIKSSGIQSLALIFGERKQITWDRSYYVESD